jgi:hypothetical protein
LADDHLNRSREFKAYIQHVMNTRSNKTALKDLPDLGIFTLVRHVQLQFTGENVSDISPKHVNSPVMTKFQLADVIHSSDWPPESHPTTKNAATSYYIAQLHCAIMRQQH